MKDNQIISKNIEEALIEKNENHDRLYQLFFRLSLRRRYEKILFSDIDGTIANDNLPITYKDQEAVKN